jgi:molybdopterin biosynthesis enzyme MoaB
VGDANSGNHKNQINILTEESIEKISRFQKKPFKFGDLGENITIKGLDSNEVNLFDQIHIKNKDSEIILEITELEKPFLSRFENIPKENLGFSSRVIKGGTLRPEDRASLITRQLNLKIINLFEDKTKNNLIEENSAVIKSNIDRFAFKNNWKTIFSEQMILFDSENLKELLTENIDAFDIIFITGGIGIHSKDLVPEIITESNAKIIPGIMEIIRQKTFLLDPLSVLQRSLAAIKNKTLIFCLPDNFDYIQIYMEEIRELLNPLIFKIRDF